MGKVIEGEIRRGEILQERKRRMAATTLLRRTPAHLLRRLSLLPPCRLFSSPSLTDAVNDVCRILSDHRAPHYDLSPLLLPYAPLTSPDLVTQVLKRCRNLPSSAHRFFLWASALGADVSSSHSILLDILGAARQFPLIWAHLAELRLGPAGPITPNLFHLIFRAYSRAQLPSDALRALHRMPDFGLSPDITDLHQLLLSLCRNGLAEHAHQFFHKLSPQFPITQKTYCIVMNGHAANGHPKPALQLFDEMVQRGLAIDVVAYNTLMAALCQGGEREEAHRRLKEMRKMHGLEPDASTYALFIRASCNAKDLHSTMAVLGTMRRRRLVPNVFTYNCIIKLVCEPENEKVEEAYGLLDEMIEKGLEPDVWSYNMVLAAHCRLREVNKALRILVMMDRDGCAPDQHTYNVLLKMLIRVGRIDRAMEVWDGMDRRGFYPSASTYAVMIHGLCRKRSCIKESCKYFEAMVDEGIPPYLSTCELLRSQLLKMGMKEKVCVLTDKMRRSTSCMIHELSSVMEGSKQNDWTRGEENVVWSKV